MPRCPRTGRASHPCCAAPPAQIRQTHVHAEGVPVFQGQAGHVLQGGLELQHKELGGGGGEGAGRATWAEAAAAAAWRAAGSGRRQLPLQRQCRPLIRLRTTIGQAAACSPRCPRPRVAQRAARPRPHCCPCCLMMPPASMLRSPAASRLLQARLGWGQAARGRPASLSPSAARAPCFRQCQCPAGQL